MSAPAFELTDDLRDLAERMLHLSAARAEIDAELNDLKAKLRSIIAVGQRATIDGRPVLAVLANRRFDERYATDHLPPALIARCTVPTFSRAVAKEILPAALYDACMREAGEPVVRAL